jgi:hypothetical protein
MLRPNSGHRQVYNSPAVRVLQYASLRQGAGADLHIVKRWPLLGRNM